PLALIKFPLRQLDIAVMQREQAKKLFRIRLACPAAKRTMQPDADALSLPPHENFSDPHGAAGTARALGFQNAETRIECWLKLRLHLKRLEVGIENAWLLILFEGCAQIEEIGETLGPARFADSNLNKFFKLSKGIESRLRSACPQQNDT